MPSITSKDSSTSSQMTNKSPSYIKSMVGNGLCAIPPCFTVPEGCNDSSGEFHSNDRGEGPQKSLVISSHKLLENMVKGSKTKVRDLADRYQGSVSSIIPCYRMGGKKLDIIN